MDAKKLISAIASPLTLAIGAAGGTTFLLSGLWWVLPLTAGAAAIVSATQYRTGDEEILKGAYAARERALVALVERIDSTLARSSATIRSCLAELPRQLAEMRGKLRGLLERQARIDAFVAEVQPQAAQAGLAELERSLSRARTEDARTKFAAALQNKREELSAREDLRASSERIAAELTEIESALSSTLSKLVAMENLQGDAVREGGEGISTHLGGVLETVGALEQALSEAFDPARRRVRSS